MDYTGKTVVVTGASQGIGAATATCIARLGGKVALLDIDEPAGSSLAHELRKGGGEAFFVRADITSEESVRTALGQVCDKFGPVDVLVNNAGVNSDANPVQMTEKEWDALFAVDLKGSFFCSKHCLPHMIERKSGSIVNISSIHAKATCEGMFPYAACKSAILGMTRSLALEVGPHQIRVNAVCPGFTRTRLVEEYFSKQEDPAAARIAVDKVHALRRIGSPEEIAKVIAFIGSDDASFVTGAEIYVDGGHTARFA